MTLLPKIDLKQDIAKKYFLTFKTRFRFTNPAITHQRSIPFNPLKIPLLNTLILLKYWH